jgi:adenosylmethionine---8-amino-7-oxononanoate aminotransferase
MTRTQQLLELDSRHVWHPFTQMAGWRDDHPLVIESAQGNYLVDTEGRRWLDGISSLWVTVHGHRHPAIDAAVRAQLDRVAHCTLRGQASVPSIELAEALVPHLPAGLTRLFYSDSGSTAVEVALKQAYQYWQLVGRPQKKKFVALKEAYHGDTVGSVSVGGMDLFHQRFGGLLFDVLRVATPHAYRWAGREVLQESIAEIELLFAERADEIAAFVVEPLVQGAAGMLVQPAGWLQAVAKLCRAHDVLLICDEVATGFGRTGKLFAVEHEGVTPDFLCLAKGLTGGYLPLAITATTDRVYSAFLGAFAEAKTFFHGHTYTGNPLACAAALASLRVFEDEQTLARMHGPLKVLTRGLAQVARLPNVGEVRQRGFMVGIELVSHKASKAEYPFEARQGFRVCLEARKHGVLLRPLGNVVVMMPPLSLTEAEAQLLVDAVTEAITMVCGPLRGESTASAA